MLNTNQQNKLSSVSFKEKRNTLNIITILLTYGYYFGKVMYGGDPLNPNHIGTLIGVTLVFIVVQILGQSVLAAMSKEVKAHSSDEEYAESKAYKFAYIVLVTGVFTALLLSLLNMPAFWIFQNVVFFFVLAELTRFTSEIVFLRRRFVAQA